MPSSLTSIVLQLVGGNILYCEMKEASVDKLLNTEEQFIEVFHQGTAVRVNKVNILIARERIHHVA